MSEYSGHKFLNKGMHVMLVSGILYIYLSVLNIILLHNLKVHIIVKVAINVRKSDVPLNLWF